MTNVVWSGTVDHSTGPAVYCVAQLNVTRPSCHVDSKYRPISGASEGGAGQSSWKAILVLY